jgi:hypothetical protein
MLANGIPHVAARQTRLRKPLASPPFTLGKLCQAAIK